MAHAFCADPLFSLTSPVFGGCGGSFSFGQANVYVGETTIISQTKLRTFSVVANYIFLLSYSLQAFGQFCLFNYTLNHLFAALKRDV